MWRKAGLTCSWCISTDLTSVVTLVGAKVTTILISACMKAGSREEQVGEVAGDKSSVAVLTLP